MAREDRPTVVQRFLCPGPHPSQAVREAQLAVLQPPGANRLANLRRQRSLRFEQWDALPVIDKRPNPVPLYLAGEQFVSPHAGSSVVIAFYPGRGADKDEPFGGRWMVRSNRQSQAPSHRIAEPVRSLESCPGYRPDHIAGRCAHPIVRRHRVANRTRRGRRCRPRPGCGVRQAGHQTSPTIRRSR